MFKVVMTRKPKYKSWGLMNYRLPDAIGYPM